MAHRNTPDFPYPPPRKHVLLLTCMDLRLLDDTVSFMDRYNLTNRYDHVVFAGAALGVLRLSSPPMDSGSRSTESVWKDVFFHHLQVAIDVLDRKITDIFILEHRDCGAYQHFHPTHHEPYGEDQAGQDLEEKHHGEQANLLAKAIHEFCLKQQHDALNAEKKAFSEEDRVKAGKKLKAWQNIRVGCFLMDLYGNVKLLGGQTEGIGKRPRATKRSKKSRA